jgi:putative hemolysin
VFPARSRHWGLSQVVDGDWSKAIVQMAQNWQVLVLPVHIGARNRLTHYFWTAMAGMYSDIALDAEIKSQMHRSIAMRLSNPIMPESLAGIKAGAAAKLLRRHVYQVGKGKPGTFRTTKNIVHPTDKKLILNDVMAAKLLGQTEEKIKILLVRYEAAPALMREIGRLRELTFRKVGEGTGRKINLDEFDRYYQHIVLWDESQLEVVGAYRIAAGDEIYRRLGISGFYTSTLFRFSEEFEKYLPNRWSSAAVSCSPTTGTARRSIIFGTESAPTWPQYNYLFGPVSVSNSYSTEARELLVHFYQQWFGRADAPVRAKHRFRFSQGAEERLARAFSNGDYKQSFKELKQNLKHYGFAVPTLYKQYTELCDDGGVYFLISVLIKIFLTRLTALFFSALPT